MCLHTPSGQKMLRCKQVNGFVYPPLHSLSLSYTQGPTQGGYNMYNLNFSNHKKR